MKEVEDQSQGRKLLTVVERIIADTDSLVALSKDHLRRAQAAKPDDEAAAREAAAREIVSHFSTRTAVSGGLAALPALIPGVGTLAALAGGALADMGLVLKFEVEMALVLSHLHGFDITREEERNIAFLLASVSTYDAKSGGNFFADVVHAEGIAVWKYTPRQVAKLLLTVLSKLALLQVGKSLARAVPLVGIAVGSSMNKVLTQRVGERLVSELKQRAEQAKKVKPLKKKKDEDVVEAKVRKSGGRK
ncbi:hypothetical protein P2318_02410 [Myxococcaceae bacterium GXIMD 01537]